jgi:hypothetical protein
MPELFPAVADIVSWSDQVTPYDERHFLTYARLLDADAADASWREVARVVLLLDPDNAPEHAHRCWESHLARAKWIATTGYKQLLDKSELRSST